MADNMMRMAGKGDDDKAKALRVDNQGNQYVQLTGRTVEKLTPVNAVQLRSLNYQLITVDIKKYRSVFVVVKSSHDADISVRFRPSENVGYKEWDGANWILNDEVIFPANDSALFDVNSKLSYLNYLSVDSLNIRFQAKSTPTTGALTVYMFGVLV